MFWSSLFLQLERHEVAGISLPPGLSAGAERLAGLSSEVWVLLQGDSSLRGAKVQCPAVLCCIPGALPEPRIETPNNQR